MQPNTYTGDEALYSPRAVIVKPTDPRPLITQPLRPDFYEMNRYPIRYTSNVCDEK